MKLIFWHTWKQQCWSRALVFLLSIFPFTLIGQSFITIGDLRLEQFQESDGLPENSVYAIYQDRNGYLWLGTQNGLVRYDGYEFKWYYQDESRKGGFRGSRIHAFAEDKEGRIWMTTSGGDINRLDPKTEEFAHLRIPSEKVTGLGSPLAIDRSGAICVGTFSQGLWRYFPWDSSWHHYMPANFPDSLRSWIEQPERNSELLGQIPLPGNNGTFTSSFTLPETTSVLVLGRGFWLFDSEQDFVNYGEIVDEQGKVIWQTSVEGAYTKASDSLEAGGFIQAKIQELPPGAYTLRYQVDHAFLLQNLPVLKNLTLQVLRLNTVQKEKISGILRNNPTTTLIEDQVEKIITDRNGRTWIGGGGGFMQMLIPDERRPEEIRITRYMCNRDDPFSFDGMASYALGETKEGNIWVVGSSFEPGKNWEWGRSSVQLFYPEENRFYSLKVDLPHSPNISGILEDKQGNLWLGRGHQGLDRIKLSAVIDRSKPFLTPQNHRHYEFEDRESVNIGRSHIVALYEDLFGDVWIGTWLQGLFKHQQSNQAFRYIPLPEEYTGGDPSILRVKEGIKGKIWLGTLKKGLFQYDPVTGGFLRYHQGQEKGKALLSNSITSIYEDSKGRLWVLSNRRGIHRLDEKMNQFDSWQAPFNPEGLQERILKKIDEVALSQMIEDRDGRMWIGSAGFGLWRMDPEKEKIWHWDGPAPSDPICFYRSKDDRIWMGCNYAGLVEIQGEGDEKVNFKSWIPEIEAVFAIHEDTNGFLWLGTLFNGLIRFDPSSGDWRSIAKADGSPIRHIGDILEDEEGFLWLLSPAEGLVKFNWRNEKVEAIYDKDYGLSFNQRLFSRGCNTRDGSILLGGINGFYQFSPHSLKSNLTPPILQIKQVVILGSDSLRYAYQSGGSEGGMVLPYNQNSFFIEFVGLHFDHPSAIRYAYRMKGAQEGWVDIGKERTVRFSGLPPGSYVFEVKASNANGIWNEEGISFHIRISPPWWATRGAIILYVLLAMMGIYVLFRWRIRQQKEKLRNKEKELEQERKVTKRLNELDRLKDQFLANTSHELRTPLHGIVGIAESIFEQAEKKDPEEIKENLGMIVASGKRLSSLVNDLLDFSRAKNHDLKLVLKPVDLHGMVSVVLRSCLPLVGLAPIELRNKVPRDLPFVLADENRLQQILFNLIGNAIKFTEKGHVTIKAKVIHNEKKKTDEEGFTEWIEFVVEDTGIGIPKEKHESIFRFFEQADGSTEREYGGTGLGLSITQHLVELHGGEIRVDSQPGDGASFFVTLPIGKGDIQAPVIEKPVLPGISPRPQVSIGESPKIDMIQTTEQAAFKVLVVDDEPINHQVLKNYLSNQPFEMVSVMSGEEAIRAVESQTKFDLILLDVMMPRMSGYEVCQKIREHYLPSELPVVMVTAKNQASDLVKGLSLGANDYIGKPFAKDEFLARLKTQINLHKINEATAKFVPNAFLHSLGRDNITEVQLGDQVARQVTVLFADIRDYTTLSEGMAPEENFRFVNAYNQRIGPIIRDNRGFVNQYLGDAIMALFLEDPRDALKAAVNMQKVLQEYNIERQEVGRGPIRIGIGFHTGPLIMGIIGDEKRMDPATISDTVNTASRIENLTKHFGASILLSETNLKGGDIQEFQLRYLGRVQVKGKTKPVKLYECIDGDPLNIQLKKSAHIDLFNEGVECYLNRDFKQAMLVFQEILRNNHDDLPARRFLGKVTHFLTSGVPDDWTGIEVMDGK